jgi:ubiquinone/menaquinone biosynthesis C-methylase UbiE
VSEYEPSPFEVSLALLLTRTLLGPYYARRARDLKLAGREHVLDFGSGPGVAALHIARVLSHGEGTLTCVDVSPRWLEGAQRILRGYANVEFRLGDIWTLDLEDDVYDVVFVHFVLHDIPRSDRARALRHLARVLKPGGKIVVREPTGAGHGTPPQEVHRLMIEAGLRETCLTTARVLGIQPVCDATYIKPAPADVKPPSLPGE